MTRWLGALRVLFLALLVSCSWGQTSGKKVVKSGDDLPRFVYPVKGTASALVEADDPTFNAFAAKVQTDLDSIFRDYEISDKATLRELLNARLELQMLAGEYQAALVTLDQLRAEQEKPSAKLTIGIYERAWLEAAIDTKSTGGPAFDESFRKYASDAINALPWDVVQDDIKGLYAIARIYAPAMVIADVKTELDPAVQKSGALDNHKAWQLISDRYGVRILVPMSPPLVDVLKPYIAAHTVVKPDIWEARDVTLGPADKTTPVLVAIWDSGIDVSLYPNQLFTDAHPSASGTHGVDYDERGNPVQGWLYPLTPEQEKAYPEFRDEIKGFLDLQNGADSPEADAMQKKFKTMSADELHQLGESEKFVSFYIHGTHVRELRCGAIPPRGWS
jgi:hypothetical protein